MYGKTIWALNQKERQVRLKVQYSVIGVITKNCCISINHVFLKALYKVSLNFGKTWFTQVKQIWNRIPNDDTAPWVTRFCHFVLALKLSGGPSQIFMMPVTNYWTQRKWIHNVMLHTLIAVQNFRRSIKKLHIPIDSNCIEVAIRICAWCQAIFSKSKC